MFWNKKYNGFSFFKAVKPKFHGLSGLDISIIKVSGNPEVLSIDKVYYSGKGLVVIDKRQCKEITEEEYNNLLDKGCATYDYT